MQVIFTHDVIGVARRDEMREVKEGYALNYLLPQGLAMHATPQLVAAATARRTAHQAAQGKVQEQSTRYAEQLRGKGVVVTGKASAQGTLYASIDAQTLVQAIHQQLGVLLQPAQLVMPGHLKSIGKHEITADLGSGLRVSVAVTIKPA